MRIKTAENLGLLSLLVISWSLCQATAVLADCAVTGDDRMYVILSRDARPSSIVELVVDDEGSLHQLNTYPSGGRGAPWDSPQIPSIDPSNRRLFVPNNASNDISVFTIRWDGSLVPVPGSPFPSAPGTYATSLHPSGRYLYVTRWRERTVGVYEVQANGSLVLNQVAPAFNARDLEVNPTGRHLYVAAMGSGLRGYEISELGTLAELPGSPFTYPGMHRAHSVAVSSDGERVFLLDLDSGAIVFDVDDGGALSFVSGAWMPQDSLPKALTVTHDDRFVYYGTYGSLYGHAIRPYGLVPVPGSPFGTLGKPVALINPADTSRLYMVSRYLPTIHTYAIDSRGVLDEVRPELEIVNHEGWMPAGATYMAMCAVVRVEIDINLGGFPITGHEIPVALLGSEYFDVSDVAVTTLRFGPGEAIPTHDLSDPWTYNEHLQDVNFDGHLDLVSHYRIPETGVTCGDTEAALTGSTNTGIRFRGADSVGPCLQPR